MAFSKFLDVLERYPVLLKELICKTEQLYTRKKLMHLDCTQLIAPWKSPARDYEFILGSGGRDFLPMVRLSALVIINTASSLKRKRLVNVSNSEEKVLLSCYFY